MVISSLDAAVYRYTELGLAESTRRTYRSAVNRFSAFCSMHAVHDVFPVSEQLLCYFVAALGEQGLAPATISTYLAAVRHAQVVRGLPEPRQSSSLPRLRLLQSGVRRERVQSGSPPSRPRLPITPHILRQIRSALCPLEGDSLMVWAAAAACFFGFFRAGELTVPAAAVFDPTRHLAWGDVSVDQGRPPSSIRVFLKVSKCDQFGRGVAVFLGATTDELCPVAAILAFVSARGNREGPFFLCQDGAPLTKARFVARIREALVRAGVPEQHYSGHSFRIGAATAAAQAGLPDSTIQALGRWSSAAFLRYIRTPRDQLAQYTRAIAGSRPPAPRRS